MFKSQSKQSDIKKLKNPFKPVDSKNRPSSQAKLPYFTKPLEKASSNLGGKKVVEPLNPTSSSSLNRSSSTPNFFSQGSRSKSSLCQMKSGSFDDSFDDDDGYLNEKPINLKNSKAVGSLLPQSSRNSSNINGGNSFSTKDILTPPASTESQSQPLSQSSDMSRQSSSSSFSSSQQRLKLGTLKESTTSGSRQATLNFGGSQVIPKRKLSPWDNNVVSTKRIKNPRIKDTKPASSSSNYSATKINLSSEQLKVIDLVVKDNKNVFYTGSAGTGKSVLLKELVQRLTAKYARFGPFSVAVTASTGLAAVNIGGITINKFSGMGLASGSASSIASRVLKNKQTTERWKRTKVLIIDEISMIEGSFLDKLDYVAKAIRKNQHPFGGIQVVLTGDFFQLPPVPNRNGPAPLFCFQAHCWNTSIHKTVLLRQVFRQKDDSFVEMLNSLRLGEITEPMERSFKQLARALHNKDGIEPTELFCTRYEVDQANTKRLRQLTGQSRIFEAKDVAKNEFEIKALENVMAVKTLVLKEDAQVMMIKNKDETLVNGTAGKVVTFLTPTLFMKFKMQHKDYELEDEEKIKQLKLLSRCISETEVPDDVLQYAQSTKEKTAFMELATYALRESTIELAPLVKFSTMLGSRLELVEKDTFAPDQQLEESGVAREQFPLLLSWALSIHKSQGQTLERVKVDLTRVFEIGQVYVALSRAVSKEGLQIVNFRKDKIFSSPVVKRFYSQLESL